MTGSPQIDEFLDIGKAADAPITGNGADPHPQNNGHDPEEVQGPHKLVPDQAELVKFVDTMFKNARQDGFVSLRAFEDGDGGNKRVLIQALRLDDREFVPLMLERVRQAASWWKSAVFCPPICTFKNGLNAKTDNIREAPALSVECDQTPSEAQEKLEALLGNCTIVVQSGGEWTCNKTGLVEDKVHLHWRLKRPAASLEELAMLREARRLATRLVGGDASNIPAVHPIRWPGSWHRKKTPKLAKIAAISEATEIDLAEALEILRKSAEAAGIAEPARTDGAGIPGEKREAAPTAVGQALTVIPNDNPMAHDWEYWNWTGMTIWASTFGSEEGRTAFHEWSAKSPRYDQATTEARWRHYFRSPPTKLSFGSLVYRAREASPGWRYENPLDAALEEALGELIALMLTERDEPDDEPEDGAVDDNTVFLANVNKALGERRETWVFKLFPDYMWGKDETAIDIVIANKAAPDAIAAALLLCEVASVDPKTLGYTGTAGSPANDGIWDPWHEAPVPRLDMSLLPSAVCKAAEVSARVSGADVDAFAIGYLVGLTACGDARLQITPKQHATDWSVPLLLWVLLVAPPSSMKSEVIKKARSIAASLDAKERERYNADLTMADVAVSLKIAAETKITATKEKRLRQEAMQQVPPPRQRVCQDITIEKYVEILGVNPGGCASMREELAGWLGALGRYTANGNDGNDRSFYCHLHDGAPFDRQIKSAKDIHIEYCAGSFLGAVQADRLLEFKLPVTDGLFQRFMPMMMRGARGYKDSPDVDDAKVLLRPVRDRLVALVPETETDPYGQVVAKPFKLSEGGAKLYEKFANDMRIAAGAGLPTIEFGECLQKMGPMWLSFALLFHLTESPEEGKPWSRALPRVVPTVMAERADALIRGFFIPHAEHFYDLISGGGSARRTRSLAVAILRCQKDTIVLSDVVKRCRVMRGEKKRDAQIGMMQQFETFGWLKRLDKTGNAHPIWERKAGLKARFEVDLKREEAERKAMKEAIKADATENGRGKHTEND